MQISLLIDGKNPTIEIGLVNGVVRERINELTSMNLLCSCPQDAVRSSIDSFLSQTMGSKLTLKLHEPSDDTRLNLWEGTVDEAFAMPEREYPLVRFKVTSRLGELSFGRDSRTFPNCRLLDVVAQLLNEGGWIENTDYKKILVNEGGNFVEHPQFVQFRTSDFDFLRSLMVEGGLNFYNRISADGTHEILVISNESSVFASDETGSLNDLPAIPHVSSSGLVGSWSVRRLRTSVRRVPAEVTVSYYNGSNTQTTTQSVPGGGVGVLKYEACTAINDNEMNRMARTISAAIGATKLTYHGESDIFSLRAGRAVQLGEQSNGSEPTNILVRDVTHTISRTVVNSRVHQSAPDYRNTFVGLPAEVDFYPAPKISASIDRWQNKQLEEFASQSQARAQNLQGLSDNFAALDGRVSVLESYSPDDRLGQLESEVWESANTASSSRIDTLANPLKLLHGTVHSTDGEAPTAETTGNPASWNDSGIYRVKILPHGSSDAVDAAIMVPWLARNGGAFQFLPRVGQKVFYLNLDGAPNQAIMLGYKPEIGLSLPHGTGVTGTPPVAIESEVAKLSHDSGTNELSVTAASHGVSIDNNYRNSISDTANDFSMVDEASNNLVSISSGGHLLTNAEGDRHSISQNYYQKVDEAHVEHVGTFSQKVDGDYGLTVGTAASVPANEMTVNVEGNFSRTVSGIDSTVVGGNSRWEIQGNHAHLTTGDVESIVEGKTETKNFDASAAWYVATKSEFYFGNKNSLEIAAKFEAKLSGGISISGGAVKMSIDVSYFTMELKYSGQRFEAAGGSVFKINNVAEYDITQIKVDQKTSAVEKISAKLEGKDVSLATGYATLYKLGAWFTKADIVATA